MALSQINMDTDSENDKERQQRKDKEGNVQEDLEEEDVEMAKVECCRAHAPGMVVVLEDSVELMDTELEAAFKASTDQVEAIIKEALRRAESELENATHASVRVAAELDAARTAAASPDEGAGVASSKGKSRPKLRKQRGVAEQRKLDAQVAA
eukprot:6179870-Pleurochrysis_carterae.AAC.3